MRNNSIRLESGPALSLALAAWLSLSVAPWGCSSGESTEGGGSGAPSAGTSGAHPQAGTAGAGASLGGAAAGGASTAGASNNGGAPSLSGGTTSSGGSSNSGGVVASGGGANQGGASGGRVAQLGGSAGVGNAGRSNAGGNANTGGTVSAGNAGATSAAGNGGVLNCGTPSPVTFSKNIRLNDDTGNANQSEVTLAVGPNGLAAAAWMDSRADRVCAFTVSTDGGGTWSKNVSIPNAAGQFVGDPAVAIDGGGTIYAVCQEYVDLNAGTGNIRLMTSSNKGQSWSSIRTVQSAPDKPWAAGGQADGTVFVSWLGTSAGIKRSLDHGATWEATQSLGNIIHGTAIVTSTSGLVHVPYNLDSDRNQLRYLRSSDGGSKWDKARDLISDMGAFCFDCNPRQHPIVGAASDPTGKTVAITWTSKMSGGQGDDDVWLLLSKDGGDTWTKPLRVNDNAAVSRQFQSWVAVDACRRVHVAWTDLRNGKNEVWYARSADPTQGFEPNIQVTDGSGSANTDFLGDYKGLAVLGSDVLITWNDTRRDSGDIYFSRAVGAAGP